jgi:hypothetical protein
MNKAGPVHARENCEAPFIHMPVNKLLYVT